MTITYLLCILVHSLVFSNNPTNIPICLSTVWVCYCLFVSDWIEEDLWENNEIVMEN